jgi:hypothetical protein
MAELDSYRNINHSISPKVFSNLGLRTSVSQISTHPFPGVNNQMATGLSNKLTGQIGEYLACAELGRRGLIATTFTGNVPEFDLIVCNDVLQTIPIQVKTTRGKTWPSRADLWLDIEIDEVTRKQVNRGKKPIEHPDLVFICIALGAAHGEDQFFICKKTDIQDACISSYVKWMEPKNWTRPINYKSLDNRYGVEDLLQFKNNWALVEQLLTRSNRHETPPLD